MYNSYMSVDTITWVWFFAGVGLLAMELFVPGLVVCFLGLAAMIVAGLRWAGFIPGLTESFTAWFVTSVILLLGLRHFALRWLPSDRSFQTTDEDLEAVGTVVDVVQQISSSDQNGRIRYGGTSWPAVTREGVIPAGRQAKLLLRDNLVWIVEPVPEIEEAKKD
ncbi:MAG TPA: NfeD family protein [Acidobacteriota bacterium]|nr:NfeD family protein [Acidobacteriota bacterium]